MEKNINHQMLIILLIFNIMYVMMALIKSTINFYEVIIFIVSTSIVFFALKEIEKYGIKFTNVFSVSYFSAIALNSLKLSVFQEAKGAIDLYYYFVGPILFILVVKYFEKNKHNQKLYKTSKLNSNVFEHKYVSLLVFLFI